MSEPQNGIYGIDLGTTYSVVSYIDETGRPAVTRNSDGQDTTPSVVYFETEDNIVVGKVAKESAGVYPDQVVSLIKREMGDKEWRRDFFGKEYTPPSISALILDALAKDAETSTHLPVTEVVITGDRPDLVAVVPFPSSWRPRPFGGTSAAAPQAAGLAALCWSRHPGWSPMQVRKAMQTAAIDLNTPGPDYETGYGLIHLPAE